jgi:hypothetical protein
MGWIISAVLGAAVAIEVVCRTLKRRRIEDSRPVFNDPPSHVTPLAFRPTTRDQHAQMYDQEGE